MNQQPERSDQVARTELEDEPGRGLVLRPLLVVLLDSLAFWLSVAGLLVLLSRWSRCGELLGVWRWLALVALAGGIASGCAAVASTLRRGLHSSRAAILSCSLRFMFYAVVAGWIAAAVVVHPFDGLAVLVVFAVAAAGYAVAVTVHRGVTGTRISKALRAADLLLFYLCLMTVAAEIGLRITGRLRPSVLLMRSASGIEEKIEATRYDGGTVRHGYPVNSSGHYDDEFVPKRPGRSLVVCVGDSFSAGVVHHSLHFTTVAERALDKVDVYNMGLPAIAPPEYHYLLLTEGLPLEPDLVVINLFVGNDLTYPLPEVAGGDFVRRWCDRENVLLFLVSSRLGKLARQNRRIVDQLEGRSADKARDPVLRTPEEVRAAFPWVENPLLEKQTLPEKAFLKIERTRYQRLRSQPTEDYRARLAPLRQIREAAGETPVVVMLIPDIFQVEDGVWRRIKNPAATLRDRMRCLWIAREWLRREGIPCLNLLPVLREVTPMGDGDRHLYHLHDTHFNARGNEVVGRALADFIRENLN